MSSSTEVNNVPKAPESNPQKVSQSVDSPPVSVNYKITPEEMWNCIKGSS
jgi:hypothetical protein